MPPEGLLKGTEEEKEKSLGSCVIRVTIKKFRKGRSFWWTLFYWSFSSKTLSLNVMGQSGWEGSLGENGYM